MAQYYECHITFAGPVSTDWEAFVKQQRWKFSVIVGDPLLGGGGRMYATTHFNERMSLDTVWQKVQDMRTKLSEHGADVMRCKVEGILKDERYK